MKREVKKIIALSLAFILLFSPVTMASAKAESYVYVGGRPIGIELSINGVMVIGENVALQGAMENDDKVERGDIIKSINGQEIKGVRQIEKIMRNVSDKVLLEVDRGGEIKKLQVKVKTPFGGNRKQLGLVVKDKIQGVGTLTYTKEDNSFGALGHPASAYKNANPTPISNGVTSNCMILGVVKGEKGKAGELKGVFVDNGELCGNIVKNNTFGVFGKLNKPYRSSIYGSPMKVMEIDEITLGKATILTTIDGKNVEEYQIEIVQKDYQKSPSDKGMIIKVTDERLLDKTGGIVQGMSGSPIIQNGQFVGAVTHVFVNDPTKGYGLYGKFMIEN